MTIKIISKEQLDLTKTKACGNTSRMLDFLGKCLGSPECPNYHFSTEYVFEMYGIFTHAVEEYGKVLYLDSLKSNSNGKYEVDSSVFYNHKPKFKLALDKLPDNIKTVHHASYNSVSYSSSNYNTDDTLPNWDNRLNVFNVDIDDNGNPTNIDFHVDMDELRKCVWNFKNYSF